MAWNQVATLKGPKGWGIANPVVEDGQLFVDVMDGTSVSEPHVLVGDVTGPVGPVGPAGPLPVVSASARTLAPGEQVEVNVGGTVAAPNLDFGIPRGDRGAQGEPGTPAPFPQWSMQAVSVAYGQAPRVEVSGVYPNQNVLLSIPQGAPGAATESIDDHSVSPESAYSSEKVETRLSESIVNEAPTGAASTTATWTQARILAVVADAVAALIDDGVTGEGSTWSSTRIRQAIDGKVNDAAPLSTTSVFSAGKVTELVEGAAASAVWGSVSGKPSSFTPSAHTHSASEITSGTISSARLPQASTSARGAVELATTAEAVEGTSQLLAVTPAGVAAVLGARAAATVMCAAGVVGQAVANRTWTRAVLGTPRVAVGASVVGRDVTVAEGGTFLVVASAAFAGAASSGTTRLVGIGRNASTSSQSWTSGQRATVASGTVYVTTFGVEQLAAGESVNVQFYQDSGGTLNVDSEIFVVQLA